ncbi:MAG: hypothetical protein R3298_05950, partial [Gammaproteobacteria bacterium]|nr:hypothetical protein [Gammaproteobacteria bacterium]
CSGVGTLWLGLTLTFELLFGRYVLGRSWSEILAVFDVSAGNLMVLVLLATALAPCLAMHLRGGR